MRKKWKYKTHFLDRYICLYIYISVYIYYISDIFVILTNDENCRWGIKNKLELKNTKQK